ncbi:hypothetical protein GCM10009854_48810 [Saccharopolyspora halophila]|uniref:Uncharacterized protein n=1 Tax=Saccharopolyspora halophila TaxID=405551 RepID=A0ABP5TXU1_9PSEU
MARTRPGGADVLRALGNDQHPVGLAEMLHNVIAHVIADPVLVPIRPPQQPLHTIRNDLTGLLSDRPPVLPFQPRHILTHPRPRLRTHEPPRDPRMHPPLPTHACAVAVLTRRKVAGAD